MTAAEAYEHGYYCPRELHDGRCIALMVNIYTVGVVVLDNDFGPAARWCYETWFEAAMAVAKWDGEGDPPGRWIKQKLPVERLNPNL